MVIKTIRLSYINDTFWGLWVHIVVVVVFFNPVLLHGTHARTLPWCPCKYDFQISHDCNKNVFIVNQTCPKLKYWKETKFTFENSSYICFLFFTVCFELSGCPNLFYSNLCGILTESLSSKSHKGTLIATHAVRILVWCTKWGRTSPWWKACNSAAALTPETWGSCTSLWGSSSSSCRRDVTG